MLLVYTPLGRLHRRRRADIVAPARASLGRSPSTRQYFSGQRRNAWCMASSSPPCNHDALVNRCSIDTTLDDDSEDKKQARVQDVNFQGFAVRLSCRGYFRPLEARSISSKRCLGTRFGLGALFFSRPAQYWPYVRATFPRADNNEASRSSVSVVGAGPGVGGNVASVRVLPL